MESTGSEILSIPRDVYSHVQTWGADKCKNKKYWHFEPKDRDKAAIVRAKKDEHFDYFAWDPYDGCWFSSTEEAFLRALRADKG